MNKLADELRNAPICIYGCGECGIQTYLLLKEIDADVKLFGDRDSSKAGYVLDGLFCRTYDEVLREDRSNILLIVAIAQGDKIVSDFQKLGFKKVYYYKDIKQGLRVYAERECINKYSMSTDGLINLKQNIEALVFQEELSIERKRDGVLELV